MDVKRGIGIAVAGVGVISAAGVTAALVFRPRATSDEAPTGFDPEPTERPRPAPTPRPSAARPLDDSTPHAPAPEPEAEPPAAAPEAPAPAPDVVPEAPAPPAPITDTSPINRVEGAAGKVALTFDDGPGGETAAVLDVLESTGAKGTFFVIGRQAASNGDVLRRMQAGGHAIANHTWDHPDLTDLSGDDVRAQLRTTSDAVEAATGTRPTLFRAPYGARSGEVDAIGGELGMRDVLWDVDTVDWSQPGTDAIVSAAVSDARDGSIILMHDGGGDRRQTRDAVKTIVDGLTQRGFELVTVPELLAAGQQ